jgi:hypothetical protein
LLEQNLIFSTQSCKAFCDLLGKLHSIFLRLLSHGAESAITISRVRASTRVKRPARDDAAKEALVGDGMKNVGYRQGF